MQQQLAVITGAASGIGLALTKAYLKEGFMVAMADCNGPALIRQVEVLQNLFSDRVFGFVCDVCDPKQVEKLAEDVITQFQSVHVLVNNAGISGTLGPIWDVPIEDMKRVFDVNLYGVLHCIQAFLPFMLKQTHPSRLINMASFYGLCSSSQMAAYAMSKHALIALSESLYFDLKRVQSLVEVSVVCPSFTNTQLLTSPSNKISKIQQKLATFLNSGRYAEDVASDILHQIKMDQFYILPDKEIKNDYELRAKAIIEQAPPYVHTLERIFSALHKKMGSQLVS